VGKEALSCTGRPATRSFLRTLIQYEVSNCPALDLEVNLSTSTTGRRPFIAGTSNLLSTPHASWVDRRGARGTPLRPAAASVGLGSSHARRSPTQTRLRQLTINRHCKATTPILRYHWWRVPGVQTSVAAWSLACLVRVDNEVLRHLYLVMKLDPRATVRSIC
jgi:hypothetical protein